MLTAVSRFIFVAVFAGYGLGAPLAAQAADYSTDLEEVNITTVKNPHCCDMAALKQEANVELTMPETQAPHVIHIYNTRQEQVARLQTNDKIVFMRLPQGSYKVTIDAVLRQQSVTVNADPGRLARYAI